MMVLSIIRLGRCFRNVCIPDGFQWSLPLFLPWPAVGAPPKMFVSNGFLPFSGNRSVALFFLGTRSGKLRNTTFPDGFCMDFGRFGEGSGGIFWEIWGEV